MDERIIIKSEHFNTKKFMIICFAPAVALLFYVVATYFLTENGRGWSEWGFWMSWAFNFSRGCPGMVTVVGLLLLIIGVFVFWAFNGTGITVTDKRIYGVAKFGKRVDLPVDSITSIGVGLFNSISIATASGQLVFGLLTNRNEVQEAISKLLVERQKKGTGTGIKQEIPQSAADELKKYKDLLDDGVISQEEFDAKKKQLLGL